MTLFFQTPESAQNVTAVATRWVGTPFAKGSAIQGAGVDCVHLCAEIYRECGVMDGYTFPDYTLDAGAHLEKSMIIEWVEQSGRFIEVKPEEVQAGDLLCFKIRAAVAHHAGLAIAPSRFVHCWQRRRVFLSELNDPTYRKMLSAVYRPLKKENA